AAGDRRQAETVARGGVVDLCDVGTAGSALVADTVGEQLAIVVTAPARNTGVVAARERDRRPGAGPAAAAAAGEGGGLALQDAGGGVDARARAVARRAGVESDRDREARVVAGRHGRRAHRRGGRVVGQGE